MAKYDREALIQKLREKRQEHLYEMDMARLAKAEEFETWKTAAITYAEGAIDEAKRTLAAARHMKFGPMLPNEPQGHHGGIYRPFPPTDKALDVTRDKVNAVERAITELELMVEPAVALHSSAIIKLL